MKRRRLRETDQKKTGVTGNLENRKRRKERDEPLKVKKRDP